MPDLLPRDAVASMDFHDIDNGLVIGPVTPGSVLEEEFMRPLGLSARALARDLGVPANLVTGVLHGSRAITARTALLLAARFGTSAEFWMNLQTAHDLEQARRSLGHAA